MRVERVEPIQKWHSAANRKTWSSVCAKKFSHIYRHLALFVFNAVVALVLANMALSVMFAIKDHAATESNPVTDKYGSGLKTVYPWMDESEINQLLHETWSRPYLYEPFTQFKERPSTGEFVNVENEGFRMSKNQGAWPPDPKALNIFVFGGSTTFGYGVPDDHTIPSYLQEYLDEKHVRAVKVYNFGRGFYFSSQERILLQQILMEGVVPQITIFIDGVNDFFNRAGTPKFTGLFQQVVDQVERKDTRYFDVEYLKDLAVLRAGRFVMSRMISVLPEGAYGLDKPGSVDINAPDDAEVIRGVVERYIENKKLIEAITAAYHIQPVFVWQPVPTYHYDDKFHLFVGSGYGPLSYSGDGYRYMKELIERRPMGRHFFWCADIQQDLHEPLYVDKFHYSSKLSKIIAIAIGEFLIERQFIHSS